jgi:hypothetical protein
MPKTDEAVTIKNNPAARNLQSRAQNIILARRTESARDSPSGGFAGGNHSDRGWQLLAARARAAIPNNGSQRNNGRTGKYGIVERDLSFRTRNSPPAFHSTSPPAPGKLSF